MALGVLDKLLTYSFKSALRVVHYFESSKWERTEAQVTSQVVLYPIWGCSSVKLHYRFDSKGRLIKGWDVIPFPALPQAKYYAESFSHNLPRIVRVNPKNPQETHFFERDQ
jgi:hypothetical protein